MHCDVYKSTTHKLKLLGEATRFCDPHGSWSEPNVLNCVSTVFLDIEQLVSALTDGLGRRL